MRNMIWINILLLYFRLRFSSRYAHRHYVVRVYLNNESIQLCTHLCVSVVECVSFASRIHLFIYFISFFIVFRFFSKYSSASTPLLKIPNFNKLFVAHTMRMRYSLYHVCVHLYISIYWNPAVTCHLALKAGIGHEHTSAIATSARAGYILNKQNK